MNERINELAEKAGIVFWEMSGDVDWRQANRENLAKFAELIVRECADIAKIRVFGPSTFADAEFVEKQIKEHFGVK